MSKPTLYGIGISRAIRSIWALEEVGIDYDHVPTHFFEETKTPEFLEINPNGRVPVLVDGDQRIFESMAINLYLAKKYGEALYPPDLNAEAQAWQWTFWGISEIEPLQLEIVVQKFFPPSGEADQKIIQSAEAGLVRPLDVLDKELATRDYLLGSAFSVADLNLAGVMDLFNAIKFDASGWPNVDRWLRKCWGRDAYARAKQK